VFNSRGFLNNNSYLTGVFNHSFGI